MPRLPTLAAILTLTAGVLIFARGNPANAQDATATHPVAGTWTWVNGEGEDAFPSIVHFHADGAYSEGLPWGAVLMGV